ncbi:TIGR03084 family metal-binding protein [Fodinicola acaciae]|uniref:TIGR03084 family metal-binding protein n=1 Tax=Fodinicola acaciae TaxID=2681555 RepID=UPI0013D35920|nr:TIGR03084 family metal-binding protein [Fodinicola acaciae]
MAVSMTDLLADLAAETEDLRAILAKLADADWDRPSAAAGWLIRDQLSHLAFFDQAATLAATEPDRFRSDTAELLQHGTAFPDVIAERHRSMPRVELAEWFDTARGRLLEVFATMDPKARIPWYGPDMSAASSVTARLMETWAHGQDIADAVGVRRTPTARLRNIAHLGVSTFGFAYVLNGRDVPQVPVTVRLTAPDGSQWSWGPDDAADSVTGPAEDFCLVVTQRRHRDDTALRISGPVATEWMSIAQAFAGAPGPGRPRSGQSV